MGPRCALPGREVLPLTYTEGVTMDETLPLPLRCLIELRMTRADIDSVSSRLARPVPPDDLMPRRQEVRHLRLSDQLGSGAALV